LGYSALLALGPSIFFYVHTVLGYKPQSYRKVLLHYIPVVLSLYYYVYYQLSPPEEQQKLHNLNINEALPFTFMNIVSRGVPFAYLIASIVFAYGEKRRQPPEMPEVKKKQFNWMTTFLTGLLVNGILSLSLIFIDFKLFVWPIVIIFFLVLNVFAFKLFHYPSIVNDSLKTEEINNQKPEEETPYHVDAQLVLRIDNYMHESTPFLQVEITIHQLADRLNISQHELSQLLKRYYEMNYFDFINGYRVEHVERRLICDECIPKMNVLAEECGFNSESAFFRIFKNHTGTTPFNYRRLHKKNKLSDSKQE